MLSREEIGRVVRETWEAWAREQPDIADHPSWLVPWDALPERDREVDMRIGDAVVNATFPKLRADVERLTRELAEARAALRCYCMKCYACGAHAVRRCGLCANCCEAEDSCCPALPHAPAIRAAEGGE